MSDRFVELYIVDILVAAFKIRYAAGKVHDSEAFLSDFIIFDAVLRELQVVGEATNHLIKTGMLDESFRMIVDFRNKITHEYFGVDHEIVWEVVQNDIPLLMDSIDNLISSLPSNNLLIEALECAESDHRKAGQSLVIQFIAEYRNKLCAKS